MIAVLLLALLLVLGVIGFGGWLLFGPDDKPRAGPPPATSTSAPKAPGGSPPPASHDTGGSGPGTGAASSAVKGPARSGDLQATARDYVDAVNARDKAAATALTCERADPGTLYSVTGGRDVRLGKVEVLEGTVGTAQVTVGDGETALLLENRENGWCVAI